MRPDLGPQDGQRHVRHLLAASRGCPPRTHAAAPSGCIGRLRVPQDYSSRGRALERRRYTCADVARVKWLLVQGRRQVVGLSVVSACSRECSTVCDSHGYSWVGHGAGGRSGAPQQPPWLTPIQFDTSIDYCMEPGLDPAQLGDGLGTFAALLFKHWTRRPVFLGLRIYRLVLQAQPERPTQGK